MGQREELLAAVRARVDRVADSGDASAVLEAPARAEAHRLAECVADDPGDTEVAYALGWLHYRRAQALPTAVAEQDLHAAISSFTGCFVLGMDGLPRPLLAPLAGQVAFSTMRLVEGTLRAPTGSRELAAAVDLSRRVARHLSGDHPLRIGQLGIFGAALRAQFEHTGDLGILDEAVDVGRAAVMAVPDSHPGSAVFLFDLAIALQTRSRHTGDPGDLDEAVEVGRAAVRVADDSDPQLASGRSALAAVLERRFERTGDVADLDEAVEVCRAAVRATPHPHPQRAMYLANLGIVLGKRFECTGGLGDLDETVDAGRAAVLAVSDSAPPPR